MPKAVTIRRVSPSFAIPGGELWIECERFDSRGSENGVYIGGERCAVVTASETRVVARVPETASPGVQPLVLRSSDEESDPVDLTVAGKLCEAMHFVGNPAVDPRDGSIVMTRSGSRGERLEHTLYRLEADGYVDELPADVQNPTGIAFDSSGQLYVTNRAAGTVCRVAGDEVSIYASELGVATGIAFDTEGLMYVGDRSGTVYRIADDMEPEPWATLEPSVSAYHIAFGPDGRLFVSAPGLSSFDPISAIDPDGTVSIFARGFGRPQGIAFDTEGNLYVAACHASRRGIMRIDPARATTWFATGMNIVGLCFNGDGDLLVATNDTLYSLSVGIKGTLLA
jgi:sugar lactone lactonase YvrE